MYRSTLKRWTEILYAAIVASCAFGYIGPFLGVKAEHWFQNLLGDGLITMAIEATVAFAAVVLLHRWTGSELRHARHIIRYPPLGFIVVVAILLAPFLPRFTQGSISQRALPSKLDGILVASFYCLTWLTYTSFRKFSRFRSSCPSGELPDKGLKSWLKRDEAIASGGSDLFGHATIAERIVERLVHEESTIALQGEFGSGKSSVCQMAAQLAKSHDLIFAFASCWGFVDTTRAQKDVLEAVVREVGKEVDCLALRELPEAYINAMGSHVSWVKALLEVGQRKLSPIEQLRRLSPVLSAIRKKVVVVIEDVDRAGNRFDLTQIQALLMQFREIPCLSFILAISPTQQIDFVKLCDHVEIMPRIDRGQVLRLIHQTREMLLRDFPAGIVLDKLQPLLSEDDDYTVFDFQLSYSWPWQLALCQLLDRPRLLKHALRRLLDSWPRLQGEVNFDQLISISTLRAAAPEAFQFLCNRFHLFAPALQNEDPRELATSARTNFKEQLIAEWKQVCASGSFDVQSAASLLKHVYPMTAAATGISAVHTVVRQSMESKRRRDVFVRRLFTERLNADEIHDQHILRLMQKASSDSSALRELAEVMTDSTEASAAFEDFAEAIMFSEDLRLLSEIYAVIRRRHGVRADRDACPGFFAPWRRIESNRPEGFENWLSDELIKCIPCHLRLLNDIYYFWLGTNKHSFAERSGPRQVILRSIHTAWRTGPPEALAAGFDPSFPYSLFHLIFTSDYEQSDTVPCGKIEDWMWSGPILLKASQQHPAVLLPQILIALNAEENRGRAIPKYNFDENLLLRWFGKEGETLLSLIAQGFAIDSAMPEPSKYLISQAVEKARAKLAGGLLPVKKPEPK
jgi:hypothetical protein